MKQLIKSLLARLKRWTSIPYHLVKENTISGKARLHGGIINRSQVGKYTYIGPYTVINHAIIGNYCSIAPGVQIGGMEHSLDWFSTSTVLSDRCISTNKTYLGDNVWIAANAIIKQGVKIGDGAVIGAGAFVNADIPPNSVAVGVPARVVKKRLDDAMLSKMARPDFWTLEPIEINKIIGR